MDGGRRLNRKDLFKALVAGGVIWLLTTIGDSLKIYITGEDLPLYVRGLALAGGVLLAGIVVLLQSRGTPAVAPSPVPAPVPGPTPYQALPPQHGHPRPPARRGAVSVFGALLAVLLFCGAGGWLAITLAGKAADFARHEFTPPWVEEEQQKDAPGVERLATPATGSFGPVTITVTSVDVNSLVTKVKLTAQNDAGQSVTFQAFQLTVPGEDSIASDPFRGSLQDVPARGQTTGTVEFTAPIPASANSVTLNLTMFSMDFAVPDNGSIVLSLT